MHVDFVTEYFGTDHRILGKVFRHAAADHEEAGRACRQLDLGQLAEVGDGIQRHIGFASLGPLHLMLNEAKACRAIGKGRTEDRRIFLKCGLDEGVRLLGIARRQPLAHLIDEFAGRIGARLEALGNFENGVVAGLEFFFVNIGVVDAVNIVGAQLAIIHRALGLIVFEPQRFKEVHVDDRGAGGDHHIDHAKPDHVAIDMHAAARRGRARQGQPRGAVLVLDGHGEDVRRPGRVAAGKAHLAHGIDNGSGVIGRNVDMLDCIGQQFGLPIRDGCVHRSGFPWFKRPSSHQETAGTERPTVLKSSWRSWKTSQNCARLLPEATPPS